MNKDTFQHGLQYFEQHNDGRFPRVDQLPCLNDDTEGQGEYCPVYVHHCGWQARVLMASKPKKHVDFGGLVYFAAIASAIVPMEYYDIRPIRCALPNLTTGSANLTRLQFPDNSLESIGCCHVMEHIGLGRYGDELDVAGDLKAAAELKRVLAPGGQMLIVLPVGHPKLCFNAHRIYSYEQVIDMFAGLELKEFTLFDPPQYIMHADPARVKNLSEGAGCFWFVKN